MTAHAYLSTSCLHAADEDRAAGERAALHARCSSERGVADGGETWAKAPARCKFCGALCRCPCHGDEPLLAASAASGILTAAAETLRYVATWGSREPADLAEVAAGIEQMRDAPPGSLDWTCCPLCQEITCDHGCPLRTVRGQP
jgi:hypothetical protein